LGVVQHPELADLIDQDLKILNRFI
jgi:predicted unusual protein kinase regulating ubiquinone biosynthesis (AarF/ABC1/UbiB family)